MSEWCKGEPPGGGSARARSFPLPETAAGGRAMRSLTRWIAILTRRRAAMAGVGGCVGVYACAERAPRKAIRRPGILWKSRAELSTGFSTGRGGSGVVASCGPAAAAAAGCAIAGRLRGLWRVPGAGWGSCLRENGGGFTGLLRAGMGLPDPGCVWLPVGPSNVL